MKRKMTRIKLMEIILALEVRIMVGITDAGGGFIPIMEVCLE